MLNVKQGSCEFKFIGLLDLESNLGPEADVLATRPSGRIKSLRDCAAVVYYGTMRKSSLSQGGFSQTLRIFYFLLQYT